MKIIVIDCRTRWWHLCGHSAQPSMLSSASGRQFPKYVETTSQPPPQPALTSGTIQRSMSPCRCSWSSDQIPCTALIHMLRSSPERCQWVRLLQEEVCTLQEQHEREARAAAAPARVGRRSSAGSAGSAGLLTSHRLSQTPEDGGGDYGAEELAAARQRLWRRQEQQMANGDTGDAGEAGKPPASSIQSVVALVTLHSCFPSGSDMQHVQSSKGCAGCSADSSSEGGDQLAAARQRLRFRSASSPGDSLAAALPEQSDSGERQVRPTLVGSQSSTLLAALPLGVLALQSPDCSATKGVSLRQQVTDTTITFSQNLLWTFICDRSSHCCSDRRTQTYNLSSEDQMLLAEEQAAIEHQAAAGRRLRRQAGSDFFRWRFDSLSEDQFLFSELQATDSLAAARRRLRRQPGVDGAPPAEWQSPSKRRVAPASPGGKSPAKSSGRPGGRRRGARAWLSGFTGAVTGAAAASSSREGSVDQTDS